MNSVSAVQKLIIFIKYVIINIETIPNLQELKNKVEACCRTAEDFTRLYYASLDNRRHVSNVMK